MKLEEFEQELKLINKDLSIRPNDPPKRVVEMYPDTLKLASITYMGSELCTIPNYEIFDEKNGSYGVDLRGDGRFVPHRTRLEALEIVKQKLNQLQNDKDYSDQFFGRGEYSDAELRKVEPENAGDITVIDEVPIDVSLVTGGLGKVDSIEFGGEQKESTAKIMAGVDKEAEVKNE